MSTLFPEEAVNEVKRQAMSELQKAVSDAERKAHEMISAERSKMERALAEAKRQASEDALTVINQQEDSSEVSTAAFLHHSGKECTWVFFFCFLLWGTINVSCSEKEISEIGKKINKSSF